jgi:hypothetical protein|tara:strand:- start:43 stop:402 length:360 start_codon:yes stop_codon:yes gene_type:complete
MTVKEIVSQVEMLYGKKSHTYLFRLINDAILDMSSEVQQFSKTAKKTLTQYQRWYPLKDFTDVNGGSATDIIDIYRVEILDNDSRYNLIPKITDQDKLLKDDTDDSTFNHSNTTGDVTS